MQNVRSYFDFRQNSQTKGFMHDLVQNILDTCERVANIFLHPGANYTYMYNLHTVCKSAHYIVLWTGVWHLNEYYFINIFID